MLYAWDAKYTVDDIPSNATTLPSDIYEYANYILKGLSIIINIFSYDQNSRKGGRRVKKAWKMLVLGQAL